MITYPTTLDSLSNPTSTDLLENANNALDHDVQHSNANDAIEALEAKVGVDGSAVTTSHDYKLSAVTGSEKALTSGTSTQSVTDLTLVTPTLTLNSDATGDMYYRNSGGDLTRLPIGTSGQILDVSAGGIPEWIANPSAADATYTVKGVDYKKANSEYYAADSGSTDAYAITLSPALNAYVTGQTFRFKANTINTGAATLAVNGLAAKTIVKYVNTTLADGDITAGMICTVTYDGTNFVLQNPIATVPASVPLFKTGIFSMDMSTTTTTTLAHGFSRTPKFFAINWFFNTSGSAESSVYGRGCYDGSTQNSAYGMYTSNGGVSGVSSDSDNIVHFTNSGTSLDNGHNDATVSWDSTNVTLTWNKTNSPTGTAHFVWEAQA